MRREHILGRLEQGDTPRHCVIFDVATERIPETVLGEPACERMTSWRASYHRHSTEGWKHVDSEAGENGKQWLAFLASVSQPKTTLWVVGWELGKQLSLLDFWGMIERGDVYLGITKIQKELQHKQSREGTWTGFIASGDPPTIVSCRIPRRSGTLKMVDVRNYTRDSLEEIAASFGGIPEPAFDPDVDDTPSIASSLWRKHCVTQWWMGWTELLAEHKLGPCKPTLASQSMAAYRHRFRTDEIRVHCNDEALALERESYMGAWCYAPFRGPFTEKLWHLDVNSLYPYAAASNVMPCELIGVKYGQGALVDAFAGVDKVVIARVNLNTESLYPVRCKGGGLDWVSGKIQTVLAGVELANAYDAKAIDDCHEVATYKPGDLFGDWHDELIELRNMLRLQGKQAAARAVKQMCNSLFGKFGQREATWVPAPEIPVSLPYTSWYEQNPDTGELVYYRSIGWECQRFQRGGETNDSCPSIASCVLAAGREHMRQLMRLLPVRSLYYCDTDSLIVNRRGFVALDNAELIHADESGKLKVVETADDAEFWGPKHYRLGDSQIHAGIPLTAGADVNKMYRWESTQTLDAILDSGGFSDLPLVARTYKVGHEVFPDGYGPDGWRLPQIRRDW